MKKAFSFYRSYYEQLQHLNNEQISSIVMSICKVQFLELHIDDVKLNDKMTKLAWSGIKHSLQKSIDGYCSKMGIDYDTTLNKVLDKELQKKNKHKNNKEVKEKEELNSLMNIDIETDSQKVAKYLLEKIISNKSNFKISNIKIWEQDIDKAINIDGRSVEELIACINWIYSNSDSFWIPVIMSGKKLRKKFDVMESQMMNNKDNKKRLNTAQILSESGY